MSLGNFNSIAGAGCDDGLLFLSWSVSLLCQDGYYRVGWEWEEYPIARYQFAFSGGDLPHTAGSVIEDTIPAED